MKKFDLSVNGLRAIAILVVMAFHFGLAPITGGFVGVDIFFVISGYVITLSVLEKLDSNRFSIWGYFRSRFFRIFPALLVVSFLTLALSAFILFPEDAERSARHGLSAISFISNFVFWKEVGYFDVDNEFKPFLHTWSLAVEFQFYLVWPIAIFILCYFRKFSALLLLLGIVGGILASGLLAKYTNFIFYMMPFRGWEFALGALIAFVPADNKIRQTGAILPIIGLVGILASVFLFNRDTTFPGFAASLPCISAFLILFFNRKFSEPLFAVQPLQYLGNISYSLYLYHWPVHVLYSHYMFRELAVPDLAFITALTFLCAHLSYVFIEQPFRKNSFNIAYARSAILMVIVILCAVLSYFVISTEGKTGRYGPKKIELIDYFKTANQEYRDRYGIFYPKTPDEIWSAEKHKGVPCLYDNYTLQSASDDKLTNCVINNLREYNTEQGRYVVIGDSNGKNVFEALQKAYPEKGFAMMMHSGCAAAESKNCFPYLNEQLKNIITELDISGLILSSRYSYQPIEGIDKTVAFLQEKHVPFLVVGATPMLRRNTDMIMLKKNITLDQPEFLLPLNDAYFHGDIFEKDEYLQSLAASHDGLFASKKGILCPENKCFVKSKNYNVPIYLDAQHLSEDGLNLLAKGFEENSILDQFLMQ